MSVGIWNLVLWFVSWEISTCDCFDGFKHCVNGCRHKGSYVYFVIESRLKMAYFTSLSFSTAGTDVTDLFLWVNIDIADWRGGSRPISRRICPRNGTSIAFRITELGFRLHALARASSSSCRGHDVQQSASIHQMQLLYFYLSPSHCHSILSFKKKWPFHLHLRGTSS